jgi:hypothetical protein
MAVFLGRCREQLALLLHTIRLGVKTASFFSSCQTGDDSALSLHILDQPGHTVFAATLPASPTAFLNAVAPFRDGLVVACTCLFAWYWLADLCHEQQIPFVLGHALSMKAIHQGKAKTDKKL